MHPDPDKLRRLNQRFALAALLVVIAGVALCVGSVRKADQQRRAEILQQCTLISWAINPETIIGLTGTEADLTSPSYRRIKDALIQARALYPKCRFLYITRRDDTGRIIFLADSEPEDSANYSPPGQVYDEASDTFRQVLIHGRPATEGPEPDRWGTWISALVPLFHPFSERVVGMLGMDIDASEWRIELCRGLWSPALFAVTLLLVLAGGYELMRRQLHRSTPPTHPWRQGQTIMTAALGLVLTALSVYLARDNEQRSHTEAFRSLASAQVNLVQQSMFRIGDLYLEGLARFFIGSAFVDRDEFQEYTSYLNYRPFAQAWEWVPAVTATNVGPFERAIKDSGLPDFRIWERSPAGEPQAVSGRSTYFPVCYLEPLQGHENILGYDLGSDFVYRSALENAQRTGLTTATDPAPAPQEPGRQTGIHVFRPVYNHAHPDQLSGFALVWLRMDTLLYRALNRESTGEEPTTHVSLFQLRGSAPPLLLANSNPFTQGGGVTNRATLFSTPDENVVLAPVFAFGKIYALAVRTGSYFSTLYPTRATRRTVWTGLLLTALLTALVGMLTGRRIVLEQLVATRTTELKESEGSYRGLFNAIRQAIYILDPSGTFIDVNDGALAMYGYTRNELIGLNPTNVAAPGRNDMVAVQACLQKALAGEPQNFEFWGRRKNGEDFPKDIWLYRGTYFGKTAVIAIASDITRRKRAERELRDSNEQLKTFIEAIPDTVQIKDGQGRWLVINDAAAHLFQVKNFAWHGKTDLEMAEVRPSSRAMHESCEINDEAAWHVKGLSIHTEVMPGPDGKARIHEVRRLPMFEEDGRRKILIAIGRDITERKQAESEKELLQSQLAQAQKMESVGRLAGGVAHDFNNMLQAILGNAALALEESPGGSLSEYLVEIKKSAQRSADLTRQLLAFASRQTVSPKVIDLNDTIAGMLKMLRRLIGEDIQLLWAPGPDLWPVKVDPSQIDQIMANLAVNARDAIGGVGTVTVETTNFTCAGERCRQEYVGCHAGDYVLLTVRDTGKGMDEDTRTHIFEPFYTTKGPGKGVGLGLATIFGIVKQNGGFIHVQSEPGMGATFKIGLPRTKLTLNPELESSPIAPARGRNETLLMVEDEQAVLRFGEEGLRRLGYRVLIAKSPEQALDVARHSDTTIDLLITDVVLPAMNGRELAQLLSSLMPNLKCLFMSGYTADIIAHRGVLDEKVHFIQKPFSLEALAAKVRDALDDVTRA